MYIRKEIKFKKKVHTETLLKALRCAAGIIEIQNLIFILSTEALKTNRKIEIKNYKKNQLFSKLIRLFR